MYLGFTFQECEFNSDLHLQSVWNVFLVGGYFEIYVLNVAKESLRATLWVSPDQCDALGKILAGASYINHLSIIVLNKPLHKKHL